MGTQQLLFIILTVIIVSIAVSVGIYAFNEQAKSFNRNAIISDMNHIAALCIAYYRTPTLLGGGGSQWTTYQDIYSWLGFETTNNGKRLITGNGQIKITVKQNGQRLVFLGYGNEIGMDDSKAVRARLVLKGPDASPTLKILN